MDSQPRFLRFRRPGRVAESRESSKNLAYVAHWHAPLHAGDTGPWGLGCSSDEAHPPALCLIFSAPPVIASKRTDGRTWRSAATSSAKLTTTTGKLVLPLILFVLCPGELRFLKASS